MDGEIGSLTVGKQADIAIVWARVEQARSDVGRGLMAPGV
jgi:predicted amidohydrolase YtcJ